MYEKLGDLLGIGIVTGLQGKIWINQHLLSNAEEAVTKSLQLKREIHDDIGIPELLDWLGELEEIRHNYDKAEQYYHEMLNDYRWAGRRHFECEAIVGLARVKHAQGKFAEIPPLVAEAEALAQEYEYNDHLAALRLLQGHLSFGSTDIPVCASVPQTGMSAPPFTFYQQALIYALRYNRFWLDEVLFGDDIPTPFQPMIPFCLQKGKAGQDLLRQLRDWWQNGKNDVGKPRPETIPPIPENISLVEAERLARDREPGDGSPQKTVVERIEIVLAKN